MLSLIQYKRNHILSVVLLRTGLGNVMPYRLMYTTIFKGVLDIIRIKIDHLKGETKWESSGSLDSSKLDIEGLKAA